MKDGKMTVLVKGLGGPDAKKYYDFDQVRVMVGDVALFRIEVPAF